ncbi:hypothetical protein FB45DRAFT_41118 [Roridomyces roridus]|uniref:Uncharacterized protein n=1 Tax=Roridomyces roridus TaxID=1738132 RepID=A0AAD7BRJ2_9AGAR|nr:hypothetical protein FB45DRAFT_41118 [Roridomyces roridus]
MDARDSSRKLERGDFRPSALRGEGQAQRAGQPSRIGDPREDSQVVLYPNSAFAGVWQPLTPEALAEASLEPLIIDPIVLQDGKYPKLPGWPRTPLLTVHRCPLHEPDGCYIVSTYINAWGPIPAEHESSGHTSLFRYRLRFLPIGGGSSFATWEPLSCTGTIDATSMYSFTLAGYGLSYQGRRYSSVLRGLCCLKTDEEGLRTVVLLPEIAERLICGHVALSPYTSALTVCGEDAVDIYYYD